MLSRGASRFVFPLAAAAFITYDRSDAFDDTTDASSSLGNFLRKLSTAASVSTSGRCGIERWLELTTFSKFDSSNAKFDSSNASCDEGAGIEVLDEFPYFSHWHRSLMRKHLSKEVFEELKGRKTSNGYTINDVIKSGTACGYSLPRNMGCMAGDYESYQIFKPFFDPVIREYHDFSPTSLHTTDINPTHLKSVPDLDPNSEYVLSTRIRVSRSISGFPFPPASNRRQRRLVESISKRCISRLTGDLKSTYISLNDMTNAENDDLIQRHILFDNPNEWAITAGLSKDWPDARGIFINVEDVEDTPDFIVWVNEEDHLRIMTMKKGGDIAAVFEKLARGLAVIEEGLKEEGHSFLHDDHLGYVVGCPSNLGTGMRASMHVKLIRLSKLSGFDQMCVRMGLEVRGKHGETDKAKSGIFDISNRHRLGFSEIELIQLMIDGVTELVKMEKKLANGEEVDCSEQFQKV